MRFLYLDQFSELGGGQRCFLDLLPALAERGWEVTAAAPGTGPLLEKARDIGAQAAALPLGAYSHGRKTLADAARLFFDARRLRAWVAAREFDLICAGGPRVLPGIALGARGRPVVFHAQHYLTDRRAALVANWAVRRARAAVIANSRHVAAQFGAQQVIYNGVAEIPFRRREFGGTWRIGLIGRIAPMKGQTDFLRAAALLKLPGARFVICGAPMFSAPEYFDQVRRLAEGIPVDFLGWREDIPAVLDGLDLLVAPSSDAEATTRTILEAFSAGVPVVAYAAGGIPEIVRDGNNGFLVPERAPEALARKIIEASRSDLRAIAERARRDWERLYTLERYRAAMVAALESAARREMAGS